MNKFTGTCCVLGGVFFKTPVGIAYTLCILAGIWANITGY